MALKYIYTLILIAGFGTKGYLQNITILPYLQDASPHSINILWETDGDNESIVEWGENEELTFSSFGIAYTSEGDFKVFTITPPSSFYFMPKRQFNRRY